MKRGIKYWSQWFAILPCALLIAVLISFPVHWVLYATLTSRGFIEPYPEAPEKIIMPFCMSFSIVYITYLIAPERKLYTAIVVMSIWILMATALFTLAAIEFKYDSSSLKLEYYGAPIILGAIGAICGVLASKRNEK